jgi:putative ABC transport system permease protein
MTLLESFWVAIGALLTNKLRAILTMLGIIIGIFAVIVLVSIGRGLETIVNEEFNALGSNLMFVFPVSPDYSGGGPPSSRGSQGLSNEDVAAILDPFLAPAVQAAAPEVQRVRLVTYGRQERNTTISAVTADYQYVRNFFVVEGVFISHEDVAAESRVAVLGNTVAEELFEAGEPIIGQTIRIDGVPFRVIGIMEEKGGSAFGDEDDIVFIPLSTGQRRMFDTRSRSGRYLVSLIYVQAVSEDALDAAAVQITQILRDRHEIQFRDEDDFLVITQKEILSAFGQITGAVTTFLAIIAGISLLVGGIGIMNIMLVSVTERTREIGLRKAVGARRRDILMQFLIESMMLALIGGMIGIFLGALGAWIAELLVSDLTTVVGLDTVLLATLVSAAVGVVFGVYPAYRAARLNPIDALRYE